MTFLDVILSLTRTLRVGYLRDIRRLTVALSRARLGLYILGRRAVFESCYELKEAVDILFERPDKLQLTVGEMFPATRDLEAECESTPMEGVEHLGQYVFQMTQAKVSSLRAQSTGNPALIAGAESSAADVEMVAVDDEPTAEDDDDDDDGRMDGVEDA